MRPSHTPHSPTTRRARLPAVLALLAFALLTAPHAFLSCEAETAGERIHVELAFTAATRDGQGATHFVTDEGWEVTLTRAHALVGPLYFYGGEARKSLVLRWLQMNAMACPTNAQFDAGPVLTEMVRQEVIDLLAPAPVSLGVVRGVAGDVAAAEVHLHPPGRLAGGPSPSALQPLGGATVAIEGTARKDGQDIPFLAHLTIPNEGVMRIIESIPASVALADNRRVPGALTVEALVDLWFGRVRFDTLVEQDDEGRFLVLPGTQAFSALLQGVRMRDAYRVTWRQP